MMSFHGPKPSTVPKMSRTSLSVAFGVPSTEACADSCKLSTFRTPSGLQVLESGQQLMSKSANLFSCRSSRSEALSHAPPRFSRQRSPGKNSALKPFGSDPPRNPDLGVGLWGVEFKFGSKRAYSKGFIKGLSLGSFFGSCLGLLLHVPTLSQGLRC